MKLEPSGQKNRSPNSRGAQPASFVVLAMDTPSTFNPSEEESAGTPDPLCDVGEGNCGEEEKNEDFISDEGEEENELASVENPINETMGPIEISDRDESMDLTFTNISGDTTISTDESNAREKNEQKDTTDTTANTVVKTFVFSNDWAKTLKSPVGSDKFAPSQTGSHHGLGLQLAVERNISTSLFLGNISTFLSNMASIYEQLGMNLVKISCFVSPHQLPFKTSIDDDFRSLYEIILSLSDDFRNSAECYRSTIAASLQKLLATNGNERDMAIKRYREARQATADARKAALSNYSKTTKSVKAVEKDIQAWFLTLQQNQRDMSIDETKGTEATLEFLETDLPWEKSLKRIGKNEGEIDSTNLLIKKLKLVQACDQQYIISVEKENNCVTSSQEKEALALKEAQNMEEDQIHFFVGVILAKVFPKVESTEDLSAARPSFTRTVSDEDRSFSNEKKRIELLSSLNLFKTQNTPYEEGMGVMNAGALGLPEDLGIQRDNIKSSFSLRENRIKVTGIILKLFEEITTITTKSSFKMRSQITSQRRKDASDGLPSESFPSSQAGSVWQTTMSIFEDEAKLLSQVAFKASKLEEWFSTSKKILHNEIDADDAAWKQVCDAARTEMRLEARYEQTKQQMEKVRQRASSKELGISLKRLGSTDSTDDSSQSQRKRTASSGSVSTGPKSTPNKVGRAFFKGGEAMKKLTENAIVQITQIGTTEKDQKETKDQIALEEARAVKDRAVLSYATSTKERIDKIASEDDAGWTEMKSVVDKLTESVKALRATRSTTFESRVSLELESSFQSMVANIEEWSKNVREKILESEEPSSSSARATSEYALTVMSTKTHNVDVLLGLNENDFSIPKLDVKNEAAKTESDEQVAENRKITTSNQSESSSSPTDESTKGEAMDHDNSPSNVEGNKQATFVAEDSPEIRAFKKQFWSNKSEDQKMPDIIEIHICAYRPKERVALLSTNVYGRIYTTKESLYFLGTDKYFSLRWETITKIEKEKRFMGYNNDTDLVVSHRSEKESGSFVLCRLKDRNNVLAHLESLRARGAKSEASEVNGSTNNTSGGQSIEVPPDSLLKDMDVVLSKTIKNVSIKSVFDNAWAEKPERESFYGSWLEEEECFDISMGEWKFVGEGDKFKNEWCNEEYDQYRLVTFKFNRTTHLYIGAPVAFVKQRHFIRVKGNDRCVLAISAEFEGIPYADTFAVEMRWIATRKGADDVQIQVGLFVNFKKKTMFKSQIKAGTIDESKNVHIRLFDAVKKACKSLDGDQSDDDVDVDDDTVEDVATTSKSAPDLLARLGSFATSLDIPTIASSIGVACLFFAGKYFVRSIFGPSGHSDTQRLQSQVQDLQHEVRALHKSIDLLTGLLIEMKSECSKSN